MYAIYAGRFPQSTDINTATLPDANNSSVLKSKEALPSFELFFIKTYPALIYFIFQITKDRGASEDIVQDVFIKYWKKHQNFPDTVRARAYLYTAAKNAALNFIKQRNNRKTLWQYSDEDVSETDSNTAVHQMIAAEVLGEVHRAIKELPKRCRDIFQLGYLCGLSNPEISQKLHVSINTVKTQKARALTQLRLRLSPDLLKLFLIIISENTFLL